MRRGEHESEGGLRIGQIGEVAGNRANAHKGQFGDGRGIEACGSGVRGVEGESLCVIRVSGVAEREKGVGIENVFHASAKARTSAVLRTRTPGLALATISPVCGSFCMNEGMRRVAARFEVALRAGFFLAATVGMGRTVVGCGWGCKNATRARRSGGEGDELRAGVGGGEDEVGRDGGLGEADEAGEGFAVGGELGVVARGGGGEGLGGRDTVGFEVDDVGAESATGGVAMEVDAVELAADPAVAEDEFEGCLAPEVAGGRGAGEEDADGGRGEQGTDGRGDVGGLVAEV